MARTPRWSAAWTTTPAPRSSSSTTGWARSPRSAAAAGTTGCRRSIGGPPLPGVGWALGRGPHRAGARAEGVELDLPPVTDVYLVPLGDRARDALFALLTTLRRAGVAADLAYGGKGLKNAMKSADRSGARFAVIAGDRDLDEGTVQVKDLASGEQRAVAPDAVLDAVRAPRA